MAKSGGGGGRGVSKSHLLRNVLIRGKPLPASVTWMSGETTKERIGISKSMEPMLLKRGSRSTGRNITGWMAEDIRMIEVGGVVYRP